MNTVLFFFSCVGSAPLHSAPSAPAPLEKSAAVEVRVDAAANSTNSLAWAMAEAAGAEGNLFFSPYSLQTAFGMAYAAARGDTASELERVLHYAQTGSSHHASLGALSSALQQDGAPYALHVANKLWGAAGETFTPEYVAVIEEHYGIKPSSLDFSSPDAVDIINRDVAEQTAGQISDLLPAGAVNGLTVSVLTNAIYFKGNWKTQFDPSYTRAELFHRQGETPVEAELMTRRGVMAYGEVEGVQVLRLPYAGEDLSMVVVLPQEGVDLRTLAVDGERWETWTASLSTREAVVWLPKFELSWGGDLTPLLNAMGMVRAFREDQADFSGLFGKDDVYIKAVYHKAFVALDEVGTEAAAATGVVIGARSANRRPQPVQFRADRPFLFAIQHDQTGALLFVGRLMDPSEEG